MSQEDVDIVRTNLEQFVASPGATQSMSPEFVWDLTHYEGWPDKAVYTGTDEFNGFVEMWLEPFESWTMEAERIEDAGGGQVVVILRQHGRPVGSSAEVEMRYGAIYTVRDGVVVRADAYSPPERALVACGLSA